MQRPKSSDTSSPSLAKRIKVERTTEELPPVKAAVKIRHNPYKLRFLEGLGLVTVDKKKGNNCLCYSLIGKEFDLTNMLSNMLLRSWPTRDTPQTQHVG